MKVSNQTIQQIERALKKVAAKYSDKGQNAVLTDIHLQLKPESGELLAFNDDDEELTRCVIEEWIGNTDEHFYDAVVPVLRQSIVDMKSTLENLAILKPYSYVLIDDEKETLCDLYLVDDDTMVLEPELLKGLDKDLDDFLKNLLNE